MLINSILLIQVLTWIYLKVLVFKEMHYLKNYMERSSFTHIMHLFSQTVLEIGIVRKDGSS